VRFKGKKALEIHSEHKVRDERKNKENEKKKKTRKRETSKL
jgi:hypothetical protein